MVAIGHHVFVLGRESREPPSALATFLIAGIARSNSVHGKE